VLFELVLAPDDEVYVNQERCEDLATVLSPNDLIVVLPRRLVEESRRSSWTEGEQRAWLSLESSFSADWDNDEDAIYDNWREMYGVSNA